MTTNVPAASIDTPAGVWNSAFVPMPLANPPEAETVPAIVVTVPLERSTRRIVFEYWSVYKRHKHATDTRNSDVIPAHSRLQRKSDQR